MLLAECEGIGLYKSIGLYKRNNSQEIRQWTVGMKVASLVYCACFKARKTLNIWISSTKITMPIAFYDDLVQMFASMIKCKLNKWYVKAI